MAIAPFAPMTADDLAEYPDDGLRREIINGELYVTPAPSRNHQWLVGQLYRLIDDAARAADAGETYMAPVDVRLSPYDVVQPDIIFIARDRLEMWTEGQYVDGAPDIVVEIVSPSSKVIDLVRKAALYATSGVAEYWTVDPGKEWLSINVLRDGRYEAVALDADGRLRSVVLAGATIEPDALFVGLPD
jgi:Uma2 family endonuclease